MNYKRQWRTQHPIVQIDLLNNTIIMEDGLKVLYLNNPAAATTESLDDYTGNAYVVPAGKTAEVFHVVNVQFASTDKLFYADNEDGTTNAVTLLEPAKQIAATNLILTKVPAGKYINRTDSVSGHVAQVWILERNA